MNKAYFFGDCFTYGEGCKPGYQYYDTTPTKKIFSEILSEKWNVIEDNKSLIGNTNDTIISQVVETLEYITEGDYVVMLPTLAHSNNFVHRGKDWYNHFPSHCAIPIEDLFASENLNRRKETEQLWDNFYNKTFESFVRYFVKNKINVFYDNKKDWIWPTQFKKHGCKFHTIQEDTNDKIKNLHLSWKGHEQFAEYIFKNTIYDTRN